MSTAVLGIPSLRSQQRPFEPHFTRPADSAAMYGASAGWPPTTQPAHASVTTEEYVGFPVVTAQQLDSQFDLQSAFQQTTHNPNGTSAPFANFDTHDVSSMAAYPLPAVFTASNAHTAAYGSATISPRETRFDATHASPSCDDKFSFDSHVPHANSSNFTPFSDDTDTLSWKHRCDSLQSHSGAHSPTTPPHAGRRRGSEYAEPGSARAVYLEKNRKAASKCRSKQKRQQEELVETARNVERRNKILKAEVAILKSGMQDLMQLVGQHTDCPDARLRLYLQREADRLATGGLRKTLPSPSPVSGSPYPGTGLTNQTSSPQE